MKDISGIQGTFASSKISFDPNNRANKLKSDFTVSSGGGNGDCSGMNKVRTQGSDVSFHSTRPTVSKEYTTGQLEYAKTCLKKAIIVQGYYIDNEFEEEHNITVEEISFTDENNFDATEHSDVVFGENQKLCGQGLRFRINLNAIGEGVFEALWNVGGANQFQYFYNRNAMDLICQHEIITLSELADHECIARYLSHPQSSVNSYWYKIDEDIEVGGVTYEKGTYIQVFANGEFQGNFAFEDEADVPIEECEEAYEVKDVVKLDINGIWVKERPSEGDVSTGSDSCQIDHMQAGNCYTITGISFAPPTTLSYDYGNPIEDPVFQPGKNPIPTGEGPDGRPIYFPKDEFQFVPVWDEVGFIEGEVPLVPSAPGSIAPPFVCPQTGFSLENPTSAVLYWSRNPNIMELPEKVWDITFWSALPCGSIRDIAIGNPSDNPEICGFFTAQVLNPLSGGPTPNGRGLNPEYWKNGNADITENTYKPEVEAPENLSDPFKIDEKEYAQMPAIIDCFLGQNIKDQAILIEGGPTCLHCDCHDIEGTSVKFDIGCDFCEKCGDGDPDFKMEEGDDLDYRHIQSKCPEYPSKMDYVRDPQQRINRIKAGVEIFITDDCVSQQCNGQEDIDHNIEFVIEAGDTFDDWTVNYAYRDAFNNHWNFGYAETDAFSVKYAERHTYRCIVSHQVCDGSYDFMKNTPEFDGGSELTVTYRKIVDADEFNKCGSDRLPSLNYTDLDLLKVEGNVVDAVGDLNFFPQSAIAEEVELTAMQGGLDAYDLKDDQLLEIQRLLAQLEKLDIKEGGSIFGSVMHKTVVESQNEFCGMGAEFRLERDEKHNGDYSVHCNCENNNYVPSLYADVILGNKDYGTICKDEYDKIHQDWADALEAANLSEEDGNRILMTHLYGPGTVCGERIRKASRIPTNGSDTWGFFGTRFVNCAEGEEPEEDNCCYKKYENKPVPRPHVHPGKRICRDDLLTGYPAKLIGYTQEDAENYLGGVQTPLNVRLEDLIEPILPSQLVAGADQNHPPYKIEVSKCLYSLKEYSFEIGDN